MNDPYGSGHKISKALSVPQNFLSQALTQVSGAHALTHSERESPWRGCWHLHILTNVCDAVPAVHTTRHTSTHTLANTHRPKGSVSQLRGHTGVRGEILNTPGSRSTTGEAEGMNVY